MFKWLWFVPLPYLASYLTQTCRSLAAAAFAFALVAGANLFITAVGLGIGISTLGLLALPAILAGYFVLGWTLALIEAYTGDETVAERLWVHAPPLMLSSNAVFASVFQFGAPPASSRAVYLAVGILAFGFSVHSMAVWPIIAGVPSYAHPTARSMVLLALTLVLPAWIATPRVTGKDGLMWPLRAGQAVEQTVASRRSDAAQHFAFWENRTGKTLFAGTRVETSFEGKAGLAVVPDGWVLWSTGERDPRPVNYLTFRRDSVNQSGGMAQKVHVYDGGWRRFSTRPAVATDLQGEEAWFVFGCDPDPAGLDGLVACRRLRPAPWEKAASAALTARLPETTLRWHSVFTQELPVRLGSSFFVVGTSFYADCEIDRGCRATLRQGEKTSVQVNFGEADLANWRGLRAEVDALLLAATGRGLSEGSPHVIRGGEAFSTPPR